jgi:hypothetical protein
MAPKDSLDIARQAEEDRKAQERAAEEAAAAQALIDMRLGPAADDTEFQQRISDSQPFFALGSTKRERRDRLTDYEDALRQGRAMYDPQANLMPPAPRGGQSAIDPRDIMRRDGILPPTTPNSMPSVDLEALNALFPTGFVAPTDDGPTGPRGPGGPRAPRRTEQDIMREAQMNLLASQLEGFQGQRDLLAQLADMREEGLAGQKQFAEDTATRREGFLGELDTKRAEKFEADAAERQQRKETEIVRQQTQLNKALEAANIDTGAAADQLAALGIDSGNFAAGEMSETTAMLHSQNMSAANFINALDGVAAQAANFAKDANDQASAAAMFGIKEDLAFSLQQVDQLIQQGLMDDAMGLQAIADLERQAREANDMVLANLDVETLRAAEAAAARAAAQAKADRKLQAQAAGLGILQNFRQSGQAPSAEELMVLSEAGLGDAFLGIGEDEASFFDDLALQEAQQAGAFQNASDLAILEASLRPPDVPAGPTYANQLAYLNWVTDNVEDPGALGLDDIAMLGFAPQFGIDLQVPEEG